MTSRAQPPTSIDPQPRGVTRTLPALLGSAAPAESKGPTKVKTSPFVEPVNANSRWLADANPQERTPEKEKCPAHGKQTQQEVAQVPQAQDIDTRVWAQPRDHFVLQEG